MMCIRLSRREWNCDVYMCAIELVSLASQHLGYERSLADASRVLYMCAVCKTKSFPRVELQCEIGCA